MGRLRRGVRRWTLGLVLIAGTCALAHEDEAEALDAGVPPSRETTVRGARPARSPSEETVGRDVLEAAPRTSAIDLLRAAPGVVATQHSGEGKAAQLFLRGFDAAHGQDLELNVAGLPVNEVSHVHGLGYADLTWLIPEVVREVKVTPGSPRAAQGDFALAGSIRYELGLDEAGLTGAATVGSFGRQRLFAGFRPPGSDASFAAVEAVRGDGFGPQRSFERFSALGQLTGVSVGPAQLRAVLGAASARFDSPGVLRADALAPGADFFAATGAGQGGASSRFQGLLGLDVPLEHGRVAVEAFAVVADLSLRNNFTGFLRSPEGDGLLQQQRTGTLGARALHHARVHVGREHLHLELGLQLKHDALTHAQRGYAERDGRLAGPSLDARIAQTLGSAWTEVAWQPAAWRFMVGGRVDLLRVELLDFALEGRRPRVAFGPHVGLKAAVERQLGPHLRLLASYGDGFRTPQARQLADGERAPFVTARGGEAGVRYESPRLSASAAGFGTWVAQDFVFDHLVATSRAVGPTLRAGASGTVTARPHDDVVAMASLTGVVARRLEGDEPLPSVAPLVGRLDASWSRRIEGHGAPVTPRVGLGVTALGARPLPFGEWSAPVVLVDARAGVRVGPVEVGLDVQNLLDARWRDGEYVFASAWAPSPPVSLVPARHFSAGAPRSVFFTVEVHR